MKVGKREEAEFLRRDAADQRCQAVFGGLVGAGVHAAAQIFHSDAYSSDLLTANLIPVGLKRGTEGALPGVAAASAAPAQASCLVSNMMQIIIHTDAGARHENHRHS